MRSFSKNDIEVIAKDVFGFTTNTWKCFSVDDAHYPLIKSFLVDLVTGAEISMYFKVFESTDRVATMWQVFNSSGEKILFHKDDKERAENIGTPQEVFVVMDKDYFISTWQEANKFAKYITLFVSNKQYDIFIKHNVVFIGETVRIIDFPYDIIVPKLWAEEKIRETGYSTLDEFLCNHKINETKDWIQCAERDGVLLEKYLELEN